MKTLKTIIPCTLLLTLLTAFAGSERYATVTLAPAQVISTNSGIFTWHSSNAVQIAEGQTGELITLETFNNSSQASAKVTKDGISFNARPASSLIVGATPRGTTVAGPATFDLSTQYTSGSPTEPDLTKTALMTVKISPMTFDPSQTVTVAPGMGNVQIALESSTNLVSWTDATNGVYSDNLRFFRVKLTKLGP